MPLRAIHRAEDRHIRADHRRQLHHRFAPPQGNRVERIRAGVVHHQMAVHVVKRIAQHHAGETDGVYADIQQRPSGQRRIELARFPRGGVKLGQVEKLVQRL